MLRLPSSELGANRVHLPLSRQAMLELLDVLLSDDPDDRMRMLTDVLALEPSLTLWACIRFFGEDESGPTGLAELAKATEEGLIGVLCWEGTDSTGVPKRLPPSTKFPKLVCQSLRLARRSSPKPEDAEYLRGLLGNAIPWLNTCRETRGQQSIEAGMLPSWIQQLQVDDLASPPKATQKIKQRWKEKTGTKTKVFERLFLRIVERLQRLARLEDQFDAQLQGEKLVAMKELAYGASHEINNPLANISSRAQTLMRDETDPERRRKLATINRQAFRAHEMISNMMHFAHPPQIHPEWLDLAKIADQAMSELAEETAEQGVRLRRCEPEGQVLIWADATHLSLALKALCVNSLEALQDEGLIEIRIDRRTTDAGGPGAMFSVHDDGPGIPEDVQRHMFDPFYSGREAGRGLGLGLSKCWRIVKQHSGTIAVESKPGSTVFSVWLPDPAQTEEAARMEVDAVN